MTSFWRVPGPSLAPVSMAMPVEYFRADIDLHARTIHARGEIDQGSVDHLLTAVDLLTGANPGDLVLDLRYVSFLGAAGVNAVVATGHHQADAGHTFTVRHASPRHRRVFTAAGLDHLLSPARAARPATRSATPRNDDPSRLIRQR